MKKVAALFLILILVFISVYVVLSDKIHNRPGLDQEALAECFDFSGANVLSSELYCRIRPERKYSDIDAFKLIIGEYAQKLRIVKNDIYSLNNVSTDVLDKVELYGLTDSNKLVNINGQISKQNNEGDISIKVTEDMSYSELGDIAELLDEVSGKYGFKREIYSTITGYFNGKLDSVQLNNIVENTFNGINAKKVEGITDRGMISISAFTPEIEDYINVNSKKVNLNTAIRYNSYEDRTYIWVATPVITTEY